MRVRVAPRRPRAARESAFWFPCVHLGHRDREPVVSDMPAGYGRRNSPALSPPGAPESRLSLRVRGQRAPLLPRSIPSFLWRPAAAPAVLRLGERVRAHAPIRAALDRQLCAARGFCVWNLYSRNSGLAIFQPPRPQKKISEAYSKTSWGSTKPKALVWHQITLESGHPTLESEHPTLESVHPTLESEHLDPEISTCAPRFMLPLQSQPI